MSITQPHPDMACLTLILLFLLSSLLAKKGELFHPDIISKSRLLFESPCLPKKKKTFSGWPSWLVAAARTQQHLQAGLPLATPWTRGPRLEGQGDGKGKVKMATLQVRSIEQGRINGTH